MTDRYIPGVPCWIDTSHPDPAAAVAFYGELFGWECEDVAPPEAPAPYYIARLRGEDVAGIGQGEQAVWNSYVWVEDAAATLERARAAGGAVLVEPMEVGDAGRSAVLADPAGAALCLWQPGRHRGATLVNEPGSLNFNILNTRDVEGARAFYGAVLGWDLLDEVGNFWALPAYGDFLEARTPGLRERIAGMGAPPRFEEVVAGVHPLTDDTPAHWGVTFAAADADAVAARAVELGGRVIAPPADGPWVRMTIVADPQGAVFTASQFVPENKDVAPEGAAAGA